MLQLPPCRTVQRHRRPSCHRYRDRLTFHHQRSPQSCSPPPLRPFADDLRTPFHESSRDMAPPYLDPSPSKPTSSSHHRRLSLTSEDRQIRAYAACRNCRVKKIKCTPASTAHPHGQAAGENLPCAQCIQSGTKCVYPPSKDRAAFSRQYVQSLETRVQALEGLAARVVPMLHAFEKDHPTTHDEPTEAESSRRPRPVTFPADDVGQMAQDERGNYRWMGSSNTLSLLDSFSQPPQLPSPVHSDGANPYFGPIAGAGVVKALPGVEEVEYPLENEARMMVDSYFEEVHPVLPVVIEQEFRRDFEEVMAKVAAGRPETRAGGVSGPLQDRSKRLTISLSHCSLLCLHWARGRMSPPELGSGNEYDSRTNPQVREATLCGPARQRPASYGTSGALDVLNFSRHRSMIQSSDHPLYRCQRHRPPPSPVPHADGGIPSKCERHAYELALGWTSPASGTRYGTPRERNHERHRLTTSGMLPASISPSRRISFVHDAGGRSMAWKGWSRSLLAALLGWTILMSMCHIQPE